MVTKDKCGRCYDRIKKGKDPITGEPASPATEPKSVEPQPARNLLEEVTWRLIKKGHKGVAIHRAYKQAQVPENATVEDAMKMVEQQLGQNTPPTGRSTDVSGMFAPARGLDQLLQLPPENTLVLSIPDDIWRVLQEHNITSAEIVELLRALVDRKLQRLAA
jgi:hypothetical protein